jgi:hypothetical protein
MGAWAGPFLVAAVLLAGAGVAKAWDPATTVGALRAAGLAVPPVGVRIAGGVEAVVALAAASTGAPVLAALVALSYLAFTGFVVFALVRHIPIGSCGCFGKVDTPPSGLHVVINLAAAGSAVAVALGDGGGLASVLGDQPMAGVPFVVLVAVGAYAAFAALTVVPQLMVRSVSR